MEEYTERDKILQNVIDEINYKHQRKIIGNQRVRPRINYVVDFQKLEMIDLPTIEGFGRYSHPELKVIITQTFEGMCRRFVNSKEIDLRKPDAKKNLNHHSTRQRLMHRIGRLTKLLN